MRLAPPRPAPEAPPDILDRVRADLLTEDLQRFSAMLEAALQPQQPYLSEAEYELYRLGKKIRPMMLLLSARMMHGKDAPLPDRVIRGAVSLEMLHVATLIHDDIVDDAMTRRGLRSVNAARGLETALIVGDLQFVQAVRGFVDAIETQSDMGLVKLVLDTAFRICCGELDELHTDPKWDPAELRSRYMETIERKTAVLFGLACESGLSLAQAHTSDARRGGFYGRRVGRAFQIMDDLLDFVQDGAASGKGRGMDLARRRLSLPIIYAMEELGAEHPVTRYVRGQAAGAPDDLEAAVAAVTCTTGFRRAYADACSQALDALEYLRPFPRNRYRAALEEIALYVVERSA